MTAVYVTGMAIWSPFGRGTEAFWQALVEAQSGAAEVRRFSTDHWIYRTRKGAVIDEIGPEANGADETTSVDVLDAVLVDLFETSEFSPLDVSPYRCGVYLGSSQNASRAFRDYLAWKRGSRSAVDLSSEHRSLSPARLLHQVANAAHARGANAMISTACASGTSSVGLAFEAIRNGRLDRVIAGGIGHFSELSFSGFNILRVTARNACQPFDVARDGMMLGDGYALLLIESEDLVKRRKARTIARVVGYASGNEAFHPTAPQPDGRAARDVMWSALTRSEDMLNRLDHINAHGTGTMANDRSELTAIDRLLSMRSAATPVAINSTKGHHGHALGAAGSVELIATLLALEHGVVPPTVGLVEPEAEFAHLCIVRQQALVQPIRIALSNSLAFGGNVASIAVEAP